jgi:phage terminase Nu1 subunit (DNA packaging protein)
VKYIEKGVKMEFGAGKFAELIEVSRQQVNNYTKQGMPSIKKGKYNYYNFEAIQWLYDNGIKQINRTVENKDVGLLSVRERKDLADAKNKEFDLAVKQGKYIATDVAKTNGANAGIFVRDALSSLPDRFIPRLALDEETKHYLRVELKKEIYETLVKISNFAKG